MNTNDTKALLNLFFDNRNMLINQLEAGEISKNNFVQLSCLFFEENGIEPFQEDLDSPEKALLNYQYYNVQAKKALTMYEELQYRDPAAGRKYYDQGQRFYDLKDKATMALLALIDYASVKAYFIRLHSESLNGELYEVVIENMERAVLHSMDKRILFRLRKAGVFEEKSQPSVIEDYINSRYA